MNTLQSTRPGSELRGFDEILAADVKQVFERFPTLTGFALADWMVASDDVEPHNASRRLFVTEIGFDSAATPSRHEKVYDLISFVIAELVNQWPDALELLRGKTFSRVLH